MALRADDVDLGRDRALVEQYQDGDAAAFEDLYRRYYGRLYRFCLRRTGDSHEAEELTQEAFARAYRAMPMLRGERRFYPWLSVIASRLCVDSYRRLGRTEPSAEIDLGSVDAEHDRIEATVDHDLLEQALQRLSPRHREVLELRERQGWSYQRISEHYGITMGAVEGLLFRARQALRREFHVVAGPEAGLAAGMPVLGGAGAFGWLARRLAGLKLRTSQWAAGWANMPALAANGVGLAMVVTSAAGLAGVAVSTMTHDGGRPVSVMVGSPIVHTAAGLEAVAEPAAPSSLVHAPPPAPAKPSAPKASLDNVGNANMGHYAEAHDWSEEAPVGIEIEADNGHDIVAGVDPNAVAQSADATAKYYVDQIKGDQP